ncbi:hypothetical protein Golob_015310 [Gossypium lobatum]|uniref:Bromo domain-containing protein n=1 Tax=Gossypium lobatum TaxID=34289 RepID=A0A7J8M0X8_9ROSI|nr:hypothetical protein [Gossypium lobatum]
MRVEEGWYSGCKSKFFRDLLLLLTNAIIFFGKESSEYAAAIEFRQLVSKEIRTQFRNSSVLPKEQSSSRVPESQMPLKPEPQLSLSLSMKPKLSVPLIACRKRSSIAAKSSTSSSGQEKKRQLLASLMNEKPALGWKQHDKSTEESPVAKKRTRESSASGSRKASKNAKARSNTNTNKNPGTNTNAAISSKGGSSNDNSESKGGEKEKSNSKTASSKKPSAANFLNRMRSSLSSNEPLTETLKGVISSDKGKGGGDAGEHKKNSTSSKGDQQKDRTPTPRTRSGGKRTSPAKRSTGRPPKRVPATQSAPPGKRGREAVENHSGGGQAKKRSRK